jgi:hypothetical protein
LHRLEFLDSIEPIDYIQTLQSLSTSLVELEIQIDFKYTDTCISLISRKLTSLESLVLRLRDSEQELDQDIELLNDTYQVSAQSIHKLAIGCPHLVYFEIVDRLLGGLCIEAFQCLSEFKELAHICIAYNAYYLEYLPKIITESPALTELILFEDASYFSNPDETLPTLSIWEVMSIELEKISERYCIFVIFV